MLNFCVVHNILEALGCNLCTRCSWERLGESFCLPVHLMLLSPSCCLKGLHHAICYIFLKLNLSLHQLNINYNYTITLGIEAISCHLWQ